MHSKVLLASTLLVASALATDHPSDKSSWGNGESGSGGSDSKCCNGGGWGDWQPGQSAAAPGELVVQIVSVSDANGSLKYYPDDIAAAPGTVVQFQFHPKNHTITESSFADPCKPLAANLTSSTRPGLKSGFVPVTGTESTTPVYNILVNDTKPIWLYCGQGPHCQKGMAMVINQNKSDTVKTIENYKAAAALLPLPPAPNAAAPGAAPPAYGAPPGAPPAYGAPPATPSESVVAAPLPPAVPAPATGGIGGAPPSSSPAALPPPTSPVGASATSAVAPSVFTGAASRKDAVNVGAFLVAGLAALL